MFDFEYNTKTTLLLTKRNKETLTFETKIFEKKNNVTNLARNNVVYNLQYNI